MRMLLNSQSRTALLLICSITTSALAPLLAIASATAQSRFTDVQGHWAQTCIQSLADRNIIRGYPDSSFRPNASVTRAEFATMVGNAFPNATRDRSPRSFVDVSSSHWAYNPIRTASQTGFLSGYPNGSFRPSQNIPRSQVLVALGNGLNYTPTGSVTTLLDRTYADAAAIPSYARTTIAAATEQQLVVNYPNVRYLNPNQIATRADVSAFLCQALKSPPQAALISADYIAGEVVPQTLALSEGTVIPVTYRAADRIIIAPDETVPLTLTVTADVTNRHGNVVIPQASQVIGELRPRDGGSQFVASAIVIHGERVPLQGASDVITQTRSTRDPNLVDLARNAAIGSAAAAGISAVVGNGTITPAKVLSGTTVGTAIETNQGRPVLSIVRDTVIGAAIATGASKVIGDGSITPEKVLTGAASGATIGGVIDPAVKRLVIIEPSTDLTLRLDQQLQLAHR